MTVGTSAVVLNPDYVSEVHWWTGPAFADESYREAAKEIACQMLNPCLRGRGMVPHAARELLRDAEFVRSMKDRIAGAPDGVLAPPTLQTAMSRLASLEARVAALEARARDER